MSFPTTSRQPLTTRMVISTSYCIPWRMEAAGAPKLTVFLKTFFVPAGNTISALMFTMFRQVEIRLISLPEAGQMRIVCWQLAPVSKSNAFSGPTRSISCPWIATANVIKWVYCYEKLLRDSCEDSRIC